MPDRLPIAEGRRFACTRCGNCCVQDGFVYISDEEIERMAGHLDLTVNAFRRTFRVKHDPDSDQPVLESKGGSGCPLLDDDRGCRVHPVKPAQCTGWPFWPELLDDRTEWERAKGYCPGLDAPDGTLYSRDQIIAIRDRGAGTAKSPIEGLAEYRTDV